jgi:hypothetical protein
MRVALSSVEAVFRPSDALRPPAWPDVCGAGIDGIGEALELDALPVQFANQIDKILDTAAKAI